MYLPTVDEAYGWLDPSGVYHEVESGRHDKYLCDIGMSSTSEAENIGWIHLCEVGYSHCGKGLCSRLTPEQRRWLVKAGFDLHEGDEE